MKINLKIIGFLIIIFVLLTSGMLLTSFFNLKESQSSNLSLFKNEFIQLSLELVQDNIDLFFNNLNNYVSNENYTREDLLNAVKDMSSEKNIIVYDLETNKIIPQYSDQSIISLVDSSFINNSLNDWILNRQTDFDYDNFQEFQNYTNSSFIPIKIHFRIYNKANLMIGYGKTSEIERVRIEFIERKNNSFFIGEIIAEIIIFDILVITLTFLCVLFIRKSILRPLTKINDGVETIKKGDFEKKIEIKSNDEMEALANSFNDMTTQINKSKKTLEDYNKTLEEKVTERTKEIEEKNIELEKSKSQALKMLDDLEVAMIKQKELEKLKTEFLSVTSHELRTPITPMKAQIQMVMGEFFGPLTKEQKESLSIVLENTDRLNGLIGDILDISKLQSGTMKFIFQKADLNTVVKNAVEIMRSRAKEKGLETELVNTLVPEIVIDKDRITQIVINLISNAIKFTNPGGKITIEVNTDEEFDIIKVKDNGIGISKEDQKKLFVPFSQVDSSMSRNYEGTGLGLAISKGIVERHGGKIWIESEPGKGSAIIFTLSKNLKIEKTPVELELFNQKKDPEHSHSDGKIIP